MKNYPPILDACCGSRMFWFNKMNPNAVFADVRTESHVLCDGRELIIIPDVISDFTNMLYFKDKTFKLVVLDPPHMNKLGKNSWMAKKYGVLNTTWETDLNKAFNESMRVLDDYGVLIFKLNEDQIPVKKIIEVLGQEPLFGHPTRHSKTVWMCFMKFPDIR